MEDNLNITEEKSKAIRIVNFYKNNKKIIYIFFSILIFSLVSLFYFFDVQKKNKIKIANEYILASNYLKAGDRLKAKKNLKDIVLKNDSTYSTLSLFMMINENLLEDNEINNLFDHVIENNKFDPEIKNLIIFKKALFISNNANEAELLNILKPIINSESLFKQNALLLLANYFSEKGDKIKAEEFYKEIILLKNANQNIYQQALSQLGEMKSVKKN